MRKRTIQRRLCLSLISDKQIDSIFRKMYGITDEATLSGEGRRFWVKAVRKALRDQEKEDKKVGIHRFVKMPKETLHESYENLGEVWKDFTDEVFKEISRKVGWLKMRFGGKNNNEI
jgi:hypothetical protein